VLNKLDVNFVDIKEFNCCGYPLKNLNFKAYVLSAARNLALAEDRQVNILTFCNCCFGSLRHAQKLMQENSSLKDEINVVLKKEGLIYRGEGKVQHLLEFLFNDIGLETLKKKIVKTYSVDLKIATHYGCHLLRPSQILNFDNPINPVIFDQLVEITGAQSIVWSSKLDCCGSPLWGIQDDLSMDLTEKKLMGAHNAGADYLCVDCHLQFDQVQRKIEKNHSSHQPIPSLLYTQLLGLCLGVDHQLLGINQHSLETTGVINFLSLEN
jgi:heterodisulfide reductase subunit B